MSNYEIYSLLLCLIVFIVFTVLFSVMLFILLKSSVRLIKTGAEDEKIITEYKKSLKTKKKKGYLGKIVSVMFSILLGLFCVFSVAVNILGDNYSLNIPTVSVVKSGSMSKKHQKNEYLFENELNNQLQTFDLILTDKLPDEFDLQLYDIVVYEVDDTLIVHRIVKIEEPNEKHPDQRYFVLQGDALETHDRFPVYYSQMRGIYTGKRIPFIGSFVTFLQSPAGYLCIILVLFGLIATPLLDKKVDKEKKKRLAILLRKQTEKVQQSAAASQHVLPQRGTNLVLYPVFYPLYYNASPKPVEKACLPRCKAGAEQVKKVTPTEEKGVTK